MEALEDLNEQEPNETVVITKDNYEDMPFGLQREDTPQYLFEGCADETEYEAKMCRLVDDLLEESKDKWKDLKQRWSRACKRLHMIEELALKAGVDKTDLPITPQAIEEAIALMLEGLSRPVPAARDAEQDQFVGALSHFFDRELDANNYDSLMGKVIYNQKTMYMGIIKTLFETGKPGPYTDDGHIVMRSVDPRYFWPDPFAKGIRFTDSRFWIFAEPQDTADVRRRFRGKGHLVNPEGDYTIRRLTTEEMPEMSGDYFVGERQRVLVKECWLRDDREVFEPKYDANGKELVINGTPIGKWKPKYPNGRLLVTANGVLLADMPNPFPHGEPPYTLFPTRIGDEILGWSDVELLGRIEDKINRLHKDMLRNARVNMNAPWVVDRHAFDTPKKFNMLTQDPGLVLPVAPGARIERLPPAELPGFIFPLISWLREIFDDLLGVQAVMRGQLQKGSQLSADAVENLQVTSSSRLRFRARLLENSLKILGNQLQWLIREFYPSGFSVDQTDPRSGEKTKLLWSPDPDNLRPYEIEISTGSGLPGSKQSGADLYLKLWQLDLVDRGTTLEALRVPGADAIAAKMQKEEERRAALKELARRNKTGSAGRKAL